MRHRSHVLISVPFSRGEDRRTMGFVWCCVFRGEKPLFLHARICGMMFLERVGAPCVPPLAFRFLSLSPFASAFLPSPPCPVVLTSCMLLLSLTLSLSHSLALTLSLSHTLCHSLSLSLTLSVSISISLLPTGPRETMAVRSAVMPPGIGQPPMVFKVRRVKARVFSPPLSVRLLPPSSSLLPHFLVPCPLVEFIGHWLDYHRRFHIMSIKD